VGRTEERDLLWKALASARAGNDEVVVVYGPAGVGRSRLVQWFGERAAELGAATSMWAGHSPEPGPVDGLAGAMARALRLRLRPDEDVGALLRTTLRSLDDDDVQLIVGALHGDTRNKAAERHAAMARALRILSRRRPVVAVLDDAHWGEDALAFAAMIAERAASLRERSDGANAGADAGADIPGGLVVAVAVAEEAVAERPVAAGLVDGLLANSAVRRIPLAPLPPKEHRQLVRELLGLEPRLAEMVVERTAGNPRYAVELVGDLVERGVLELHASGFGLQRGAVMALPASLHSMWSERLERMLQTLPPEARKALELGAVLGEDGDTGEWVSVCERAGLADAAALVSVLVDALERARFVTVDVNQGGALRFAHAMLREAMTRLADEGGRLVAHHLIIAAHLDARRRRGDDERRARHLFAAGELDAALPVLFAAVHQTLSADGSARAAALLDEAFSALDKADVGEHDPRRLCAMALRARVLADAGRYDESEMWARLVGADAPRVARVDALRARALVAARKGNLEHSIGMYQDLLVLASGDVENGVHGDDADHASDDVREVTDAVDDALIGLADGHYYQGRLADAEVVFGKALSRMQERGDLQAVALCLWNLAYVALWRGDPAAARECLLRAGKLARGQSLHTLLGLTRNALGDVERVAGLPDDARRHYEEARAALEKAGSGKVRTVEVNLALCAITTGHIDVAVHAAEALLPRAAQAGEAVLSSLCHGVLAVGAAVANDWSVADAHLAAFLVPQTQGLVDGEHALLAEAFAHLALKAKEPWRAGVAVSAAREVWAALGREDRLETLPETLPSSSSSSSSLSPFSTAPTTLSD
jgi:tetratricopeptide (TPR) repeat protein